MSERSGGTPSPTGASRLTDLGMRWVEGELAEEPALAHERKHLQRRETGSAASPLPLARGPSVRRGRPKAKAHLCDVLGDLSAFSLLGSAWRGGFPGDPAQLDLHIRHPRVSLPCSLRADCLVSDMEWRALRTLGSPLTGSRMWYVAFGAGSTKRSSGRCSSSLSFVDGTRGSILAGACK